MPTRQAAMRMTRQKKSSRSNSAPPESSKSSMLKFVTSTKPASIENNWPPCDGLGTISDMRRAFGSPAHMLAVFKDLQHERYQPRSPN